MKPENRALAIAVMGFAVIVVTGGVISVLYAETVQYPWTSGTTTIGGVAYYNGSVDVVTNPLFSPVANQTTAEFQGVLFRFAIYETMKCPARPVLNVTGTEPSGVTFSFLITPVPRNCAMQHPTVLSPDGAFGATWQGTSATVILLVRVS